jgi:hypothetical protein
MVTWPKVNPNVISAAAPPAERTLAKTVLIRAVLPKTVLPKTVQTSTGRQPQTGHHAGIFA